MPLGLARYAEPFNNGVRGVFVALSRGLHACYSADAIENATARTNAVTVVESSKSLPTWRGTACHERSDLGCCGASRCRSVAAALCRGVSVFQILEPISFTPWVWGSLGIWSRSSCPAKGQRWNVRDCQRRQLEPKSNIKRDENKDNPPLAVEGMPCVRC